LHIICLVQTAEKQETGQPPFPVSNEIASPATVFFFPLRLAQMILAFLLRLADFTGTDAAFHFALFPLKLESLLCLCPNSDWLGLFLGHALGPFGIDRAFWLTLYLQGRREFQRAITVKHISIDLRIAWFCAENDPAYFIPVPSLPLNKSGPKGGLEKDSQLCFGRFHWWFLLLLLAARNGQPKEAGY
jgi:hypothetical protein